MNEVIDKSSLLKDFKKGKLVESFLKDYQSMPLDVVSIAQARETIQSASEKQHSLINKEIDAKMYANILLVLDFIQESLMTVPHERRKAITLGDYMARH